MSFVQLFSCCMLAIAIFAPNYNQAQQQFPVYNDYDVDPENLENVRSWYPGQDLNRDKRQNGGFLFPDEPNSPPQPWESGQRQNNNRPWELQFAYNGQGGNGGFNQGQGGIPGVNQGQNGNNGQGGNGGIPGVNQGQNGNNWQGGNGGIPGVNQGQNGNNWQGGNGGIPGVNQGQNGGNGGIPGVNQGQNGNNGQGGNGGIPGVNQGQGQGGIPGVNQGQGNGNNPGIPGVNQQGTTTTTTGRPARECSCTSTAEYNPVCGTNNRTYSNPGRLRCATECQRRSGVTQAQQITLQHYGVCRTTPETRG